MSELAVDAATLDDVLRPQVDDSGPGAVVAVSRDGQLMATAARGLASLEHRRPITADTVFDIASVSKQMTSAVALLLDRAGTFDLDADTRELVPELDIGCRVTFRDCLQHLAGLPDYLTMSETRGDHLGDLSGDVGFIRALREIHEPVHPPGTRIQYSNTGYVVTALAIHRGTGRRLDDHMARLVFEPLSMTNSRLRDARGLVVPDMAFSYSRDSVGRLRREEMPLVQFGDGAVQTTVGDLARWLGFLQDGRVLGAELRDELAVPGVLADGRSTRYGFGLMLGRRGGAAVVEHSGGMYGYRSHLVAVPHERVGVTVLANSDGIATRTVAWEVLDRTLDGALNPRPDDGPGGAAAPDVSGTWFSSQDHDVFDLEPTAAGNLRLTDAYGGHDLRQVDSGVWSDPTRYVTLRAAPDGLEREDRLGHRSTFVRLDPTERVATPAEGRYACDLDRAPVEIRGLDGDLELTCGTSTPRRLRWRGAAESAAVYSSGPVTLVHPREAGGEGVALTVDGLRLTCLPARS